MPMRRTEPGLAALLAIWLAALPVPAMAQGSGPGIVNPARACTGGRGRNVEGRCICPSDKPLWTGMSCERDGPPACSGGRERNLAGHCICPPVRPRWNGKVCR